MQDISVSDCINKLKKRKRILEKYLTVLWLLRSNRSSKNWKRIIEFYSVPCATDWKLILNHGWPLSRQLLNSVSRRWQKFMDTSLPPFSDCYRRAVRDRSLGAPSRNARARQEPPRDTWDWLDIRWRREHVAFRHRLVERRIWLGCQKKYCWTSRATPTNSRWFRL